MSLDVLPASFGDCLLLTCHTPTRPWRLLVDTGPDETYSTLQRHLRLLTPNAKGKRVIDAFVVSHIDHDHIGGAALLLNDASLDLEFGDIWFNAPKPAVAQPRGVAEGQRLAEILGPPRSPCPGTSRQVASGCARRPSSSTRASTRVDASRSRWSRPRSRSSPRSSPSGTRTSRSRAQRRGRPRNLFLISEAGLRWKTSPRPRPRLQFERQIQTSLHGRQDRAKLPAQSITNQDRFKSGRDELVVYPRAFPAASDTADDVWAFASLGENLKSCPPSAVPELYWQTLRLRNAIAHGHYFGWPHVRMALRMLRYFDTST